MSGPDIIRQTENLYTWDNDGYTKIQTRNEHPANLKPRSLVSVVKEQCREGGANMTAFKVKREGKWMLWSFSDYYREI